ncbi:30685_t:CDS:2, partial [Gigaspora margarita]
MSEFNKVKNIVDKTIGGHPLKPIWNFYNRGKLIDKLGHYEATCQASQMEKYIIDECTKVSKEIKEA